MSVVYLKDLVVEATHGVHAHEKTTPQRFNISVELQVNTPDAYLSDQVDDTISYSDIRQIVIEITKNNTFNLIERLADAIITELFSDQRVKEATLNIEKLDVYESGIPGIRVTRQNITN